jgi:hypothetical protein
MWSDGLLDDRQYRMPGLTPEHQQRRMIRAPGASKVAFQRLELLDSHGKPGGDGAAPRP